jgi:anthranilate synthase component II
MKLLILDNYDSFTYNLVHLVEKVSEYEPVVARNDKITLEEIEKFDKIILSPGPGLPKDAGIMNELIANYAPKKPILGVCLGMQAIGEVFGAQLQNTKQVYHGLALPLKIIEQDSLFEGCPETFLTGRYHSWIVSKTKLPSCLKVLAEDNEKQIMALRHKQYDVCGVQFHPESILSEHGEKFLKNWLNG